MTYEYQCTDEKCNVVRELILASHNDRPESIPCHACGGVAAQVILTPPAVSRQGSADESFDSAIGRDANRRWENIRERQAKRDKLRQESGSEALTMTGFDQFKPLPGAKLDFVSTEPEWESPKKAEK